MRLESNPSNGTITARGMIGDFDNGISADDFRDVLAEHGGKDVTIHLDSEGGSVSDGLSIYNAISQHEGNVTVHIDTLAASIATVICCAADRVVMNGNAKYFVHRCWTTAMGNCKDFRRTADTMEMLDGDIADVYADRTGSSKDELLAMMDAETWLTAEEAVAQGFVDEVHEVRKEKPQASQPQEIKAVAPVSMSASLRAGMSRRLRMRKH